MSTRHDEEIARSRKLLQNPYAHLDGEGGFSAISSRATNFQDPRRFNLDVDKFRDRRLVGKRVSFEKIQETAIALQKSLWVNRDKIWGDGVLSDPIDALDPSVVFQLMGYDFESDKPLGEMITPDGPTEVAGFIDESKRFAGVSSQIPHAMRQFTAAHELGHALFHRAVGLHRDRGLDGSPVAGPRNRIELEADKFAALFLMPDKMLRAEFEATFGKRSFTISDDTAFFLVMDSAESLRQTAKNLRGLSRILAATERYGERHFQSLADRFRVSTEAMAIRLEELGLLQF